MNKKIAVITGANKGIGFETVRQLAQRNFHVLLTSRDMGKGLKASKELQLKGLDVRYSQLDVSNLASIEEIAGFLKREYGQIDVLVNNAGIFLEKFEAPALSTPLDVIEKTLQTNLFGPLRLIQTLSPLIKANGRIINLSSGLGQLSDMQGGVPGYRLSKTGLNALTRIFSSELAAKKIAVNSVCPGWVKTDMGGPNAERNVEQGADTIVWLAEIENPPTGKFFRDRKEISW